MGRHGGGDAGEPAGGVDEERRGAVEAQPAHLRLQQTQCAASDAISRIRRNKAQPANLRLQ